MEHISFELGDCRFLCPGFANQIQEERKLCPSSMRIGSRMVSLTTMLAPSALGESHQVGNDKTAEGQAKNRRVLVRVLKKKGIAEIQETTTGLSLYGASERVVAGIAVRGNSRLACSFWMLSSESSNCPRRKINFEDRPRQNCPILSESPS